MCRFGDRRSLISSKIYIYVNDVLFLTKVMFTISENAHGEKKADIYFLNRTTVRRMSNNTVSRM